MAKIIINKEDLDLIIKNYKEIDKSFYVKTITPKKNNKNAQTYKFLLQGNDCCMDVYLKKDNVNIVPIGKNVETTNILINYIKSKGYDANISSQQLVIKTRLDFIESLCEFLTINYSDTIKIENNKDNIYIFLGYNNDKVTINDYNNKIVLQGRPFYVFSIILSFIAQEDNTLVEYYSSLKSFTNINKPFEAINTKMEHDLGNAYTYLDTPLIKGITSSIMLLEQNKNTFLPDYSGCITGTFKALEGYLKKLLSKRFNYKFKNNNFDMFDKLGNQFILKPNVIKCTKEEANYINRLYTLFNSKRNTYLHSKINPGLTAVISNYMDAKSIHDEIIETIKNSYSIIFGD